MPCVYIDVRADMALLVLVLFHRHRKILGDFNYSVLPLPPPPHTHTGCDHTSHNDHFLRHLSAPVLSDSLSSENLNKESDGGDEKVDKVYTVGCFDLFHRGHRKLLKNMRNLGTEVTIIDLICIVPIVRYKV